MLRINFWNEFLYYGYFLINEKVKEAIKTNNGNFGGGITFGYNISPTVGGNISINDFNK